MRKKFGIASVAALMSLPSTSQLQKPGAALETAQRGKCPGSQSRSLAPRSQDGNQFRRRAPLPSPFRLAAAPQQKEPAKIA